MSIFLQQAAHTWERKSTNEKSKSRRVKFRLPAKIRSVKVAEPRPTSFKKKSYACQLKVWLGRIRHPRVAADVQKL